MLLKKLILNNFGIYADRHVIELMPDSTEKPIILFGGLNGGGKTTILEALQVALYGKLADTSRRKGKGYPEYLESLINKHASTEQGASVEVVFDDTDTGSEYAVYRQWAKRGQSIRETLQVALNGTLVEEIADSWDEEVDKFLPQRLCNLFFFDGEQIEQLAHPDKAQSILDTAIGGLLGIELVDQAIGDLSILQRRVSERVSSDGIDEVVAEAREKLSQADAHVLREYADFDATNAEYVEEVNQLEKAELSLEKKGGAVYENLSKLEKNLANERHKKAMLEAGLRHLSAGALPLALLADEIADLIHTAEMETLNARNLLKQQVLKDASEKLDGVLQNDKLSASVRRRVSEWFTAAQRSLDAEEVPNTLGMGEGFGSRLRNIKETVLPDEIHKAADTVKLLDRQSRKLTNLDRRLQAAPDTDTIADALSQRERLRIRVAGLRKELDLRRKALEQVESERDSAEKRLIELRHDRVKSEADRLTINVADEMISGLTSFKKRVIAKHLSRLEELIVDSYAQLLRKKSLVSRISIEPQSLRMAIFDAAGNAVMPERLSAGERQLLATAVLWGLAKASGRSLPVVIDTPLGRLDSSHREKLVEHYFPNASSQVILLSTDEEIGADHLKTLDSYVSKKYWIEFDDESGSSVVREGYFETKAA